MRCLLGLLVVLVSISTITASYNGPFILWGRDELAQVKTNSLSELDAKFLHNIYSDSPAIILFVRNASTHLKKDQFPIFADLLSKTNYVYLTQQHLGVDPIEFNLNAEVINLVGPTSQQDVELSALYRDAVITYGEGKVLGILATKTSDHEMRKRAADEKNKQEAQMAATLPKTEPEKSEPKNVTDFIFYPPEGSLNKILLYTDSPPVLYNGTHMLYLNDSVSTTISTDRRIDDVKKVEKWTLTVRYNYKSEKERNSNIGYIFNKTGGYWALVAVDIDFPNIGNHTLLVVGDPPSAPVDFSYKCSRSLRFQNGYQNGSVFVELSNIQFQANVSKKHFNDSYDCIGFTSAPIWSGIFVSFIICFAVAFAINCILEIKPPTRFENSRGKQLTFTIQE